ncbi:MAG TPA: hypothetical protein VKZ49_15635 [Polyangiaceae bacterium]|nr:hypothetical protein [Polyangiaceae bacterium]
MSDPRPWAEPASDATDLERAVLQADEDVAIPAGAPDEVWRKLIATLGPPPGGGDAGGSGPAPSGPDAASAAGGSGTAAGAASAPFATAFTGAGVALATAKAFLVGSGVGVLLATGSSLVGVDSAPSAPVDALAPVVAAPPAAPALATVASLPATEPAPASTAAPASVRVPAVARRAPSRAPLEPPGAPEAVAAFRPPETPARADASRNSALKLEADLIRRARAELRRGDAVSAIATLDRIRSTISRPRLSEEREALAIEALLVSGQRARARERARAFQRAFPESPHGARLRSLLAAE